MNGEARRPTPDEIRAAAGRSVPDVIAPGLRVLFCGINPGLYSGAVGHHFARPGNRFWWTLHAAGFTERLLRPCEDGELLQRGYGLTNLVDRATGSAAELTAAELERGGARLEAKARRYRPGVVAVLGLQAYRMAFARRDATPGPRPEGVGGRRLWVLPNPSGLNAHYRREDLARIFRELRDAVA